MINMKIIGCGGAGNKAVCQFVDDEFIGAQDILLMNSNEQDIPQEYRDNALVYGTTSYGGSGKDRTIGKNLLLTDLRKQKFLDKLEKFCSDPETDIIVLVASSEGGSGSSAIPLLSKYIKEVIEKPVICTIFFGFEEDVRGLQNSIALCKELSENIGVIGISNAKFLDGANKRLAEKSANIYAERALSVIAGKTIYESSQNIDKRDLMKIITTPGYINVVVCPIPKSVKNRTQYDEIINLAIDNSKYLDNADRKKCARIGCIFDLKDPDNVNYVDFRSEVLRERYGVPFEYFTHVQLKALDADECVTWIVSGQELPVEEVKSIYNRYIEASRNLDKKSNIFFDEIGSLTMDDNSAFDVNTNKQRSDEEVTKKRKKFFDSAIADDPLY